MCESSLNECCAGSSFCDALKNQERSFTKASIVYRERERAPTGSSGGDLPLKFTGHPYTRILLPVPMRIDSKKPQRSTVAVRRPRRRLTNLLYIHNESADQEDSFHYTAAACTTILLYTLRSTQRRRETWSTNFFSPLSALLSPSYCFPPEGRERAFYEAKTSRIYTI